MNRRDFLARGAAVAGGVALNNFPYQLFAGATKKQASDRVRLGPRKVEFSRLAMGTGTNGAGGSSNQTRKLGIEGVANLFKLGFDHGCTFWDSADQYGSHPHVKEALKSVKRENVAIGNRLHRHPAAALYAGRRLAREEKGRHGSDLRGPAEGHRARARHLEPHHRGAADIGADAMGGSGSGAPQSGAGRHGCCARGGDRRRARAGCETRPTRPCNSRWRKMYWIASPSALKARLNRRT